MPDLKISQLPVATTPLAGTELVPIVQGGVTDQTTVQAILTGTVPSGTANGVLFLNGSKVVTSGSGLVFDSSGNLGIGTSSPTGKLTVKTGTNENLNIETTGSGDMRLSALNDAASTVVQLSIQAAPLYFRSIGGAINATLDSSGNLGLGVTPSAWSGSFGIKAFDISGGAVYGSSSDVNMVWNGYFNASNQWTYKTSASANLYSQDGAHKWYISTDVTPTAGNAISFTQAMTLDASGNLGIGETSLTERITARKDGAGEYCTIQAKNANSTALLNIGVGGSTVGNTPLQNNAYVVNGGNSALLFGTNDTERARIPAVGGMVVGTAALTTTATDGFLYVPTCAGTPTGTPTTQTGTAPIVVDTTNNKLYFYSGGQWRDAGP